MFILLNVTFVKTLGTLRIFDTLSRYCDSWSGPSSAASALTQVQHVLMFSSVLACACTQSFFISWNHHPRPVHTQSASSCTLILTVHQAQCHHMMCCIYRMWEVTLAYARTRFFYFEAFFSRNIACHSYKTCQSAAMFNGLPGGQPGLSAPTWGQLRTFFAIPGIEHIPFVLESLAGGRCPTDDVEAIISRAIAPMQQSLYASLSQVLQNYNSFPVLCSSNMTTRLAAKHRIW